jgi:hypothetical protein
VTIPTWAGPAVSPLWGIGDQLAMQIASGADWSIPFRVFGTDRVTPLNVTDPVIEMRRDRTSNSQLLAHFDATGDSPGVIIINGPGDWTLAMSAEATSALPSGRGFWDCFGTVAGHLTPVASGIVVVSPRVTASTGSGSPVPVPGPPPAQAPVTVEAEPAVINLRFVGGDDYPLDLTLAEDGLPADLSAHTASAQVTTSTRAHLADFEVRGIDANVIHLFLPAALTATLPASCAWRCHLAGPEGTITIATGTVSVTP